jgi:hypothetical protein
MEVAGCEGKFAARRHAPVSAGRLEPLRCGSNNSTTGYLLPPASTQYYLPVLGPYLPKGTTTGTGGGVACLHQQLDTCA